MQFLPWRTELQYWSGIMSGFASVIGLSALYLSFVSAKAAKLSAQAAKLSADSVMRGDRAWVMMEATFNGELGFKFRLPELGREGIFTIELRNVGKTPAQIDAVTATGQIVKDIDLSGMHPKYPPKTQYDGRLLVPGSPFQKGVLVPDDPDWGDDLVEALIEGDAYILIYAHVQYRDIYENHHETKTAMLLSWKTKDEVDEVAPRVSQVGGSQLNVVT